MAKQGERVRKTKVLLLNKREKNDDLREVKIFETTKRKIMKLLPQKGDTKH